MPSCTLRPTVQKSSNMPMQANSLVWKSLKNRRLASSE
jgi:hypothetical protein